MMKRLIILSGRLATTLNAVCATSAAKCPVVIPVHGCFISNAWARVEGCSDRCVGIFGERSRLHLSPYPLTLFVVLAGNWYCSYCKAIPGVTRSKGPAQKSAKQHVDKMELLKEEKTGQASKVVKGLAHHAYETNM